ncbi:hypothetical protein [Massilia sp. CF038]|uniref:hypothetical protein n=1 Tax=Massilia sp. CF038 TaxID=1881045 RepID=UPI000914D156|nr:hypothetical protein [Massilia sp. CF038]SHG75791.1 hypothetical protein SAMN05428948_1912 [Massilia sp. CF038]
MEITQTAVPTLRAISAANPITAPQTPVVDAGQSLSLLSVAPTAVDLSTQGRFLSLASLFQKKTLELQASLERDNDSSDAFANVTASLQALANVFNELQLAPVDDAGALTDRIGQGSLTSQFFAQFGASEDEGRVTLGRIGLQFATGPTPSTPGSFRVDDAALQSALRDDLADTTALLTRSADALFGVVSSQIQSQSAQLAPFDQEQQDPLESLDLAAPALQAQIAEDRSPALFVQNLLTDALREGSALPDDPANGLALPGDEAVAPANNQPPATAAPTAPFQAEQALGIPALPSAAAQTIIARENGVQAQDASLAVQAASAAAATKADAIADEARQLAQQLAAEREAARLLDEKIAGASEEVRAALAAEIEARDSSRTSEPKQAGNSAQQRDDSAVTDVLSRIEPALRERLLPAASARPIAIPVRDPADPVSRQPDLAPLPVALPSPASQAQLAARDPAIAAAIAAYNLSTGPFAAQNLKPDNPPPRPKPIPAVAAVSKVAALESLGTPRGSIT